MNTVTIHVPYDSGFASGGSPATDLLFSITNALDWLVSPIECWKARKRGERLRTEFEEKNLKEGKNADGSYSKEFPATMTLSAALSELGFPLPLIKELSSNRDNIVERKGDVPLGELTAEELESAVHHCQVSLW